MAGTARSSSLLRWSAHIDLVDRLGSACSAGQERLATLEARRTTLDGAVRARPGRSAGGRAGDRRRRLAVSPPKMPPRSGDIGDGPGRACCLGPGPSGASADYDAAGAPAGSRSCATSWLDLAAGPGHRQVVDVVAGLDDQAVADPQYEDARHGERLARSRSPSRRSRTRRRSPRGRRSGGPGCSPAGTAPPRRPAARSRRSARGARPGCSSGWSPYGFIGWRTSVCSAYSSGSASKSRSATPWTSFRKTSSGVIGFLTGLNGVATPNIRSHNFVYNPRGIAARLLG